MLRKSDFNFSNIFFKNMESLIQLLLDESKRCHQYKNIATNKTKLFISLFLYDFLRFLSNKDKILCQCLSADAL